MASGYFNQEWVLDYMPGRYWPGWGMQNAYLDETCSIVISGTKPALTISGAKHSITVTT
jgi:hypothetical protein